MNVDAGYDALVAGAGVVGVACARALQRAGLRVCLTDPGPPGGGCSFGNAGVVASEHVLPLARLQTLLRLPAMLARDGPLYLKPTRLPGLLPWFLRFAAACLPTQVTRGTRAIAALTSRALPAWQRELAASGGLGLLQTGGMYSVYRSDRAFVGDARERELARELGVRWELLDGDALREREPALAGTLRHAVFYPDVAHVLSPQRTVACLVGAFVAAGGTLLDEAVGGVTSRPHEVEVALQRRRLRCRYLVIAAGLASRGLCGLLGWTPPLIAEMGYHVTFPGARRLGAPVAAAEEAFIATPMDDHLRVAGTVEFARHETSPAWHRADRLVRQAAGLFVEPLPAPAGRWRGSRPSLPDFLPAIGPIPGHPRVIAAFGHQHIGLTTAAVTGELVRDLVRGEVPEVDAAPYAPARFASGDRGRP